MKFLIGCDPEIFVGDKNGVKSIIGKVGGTKEHPLALPIGEGFAVQEDNVAMEFNIPPASSRGEFIGRVGSAVEFLSTLVNDKYGYHLVKESAMNFPESELDDPRALTFGCDPDFNAWTGGRNPRPHTDDRTLRSCGGHIHVGVNGWDKKGKIHGVQAMDLFLAIPSVFMDNGVKRKKLYGKGGAWRDKPYGFEYRVLSNYWVFNPELTGWVYDNTNRALDAVTAGMDLSSDSQIIQEAINTNNKELAMSLVNRYNLDVLHA